MAGDMVSYLFNECQSGGHAVTVIEEINDSFTHVSGNTGDAVGVGISESKRLLQEPKPKGGGKLAFVLGKCNKNSTPEEWVESKIFISKFDFQGANLVYSIVRYGGVFAELEALSSIEDQDRQAAEEQKFLDKFRLIKIQK